MRAGFAVESTYFESISSPPSSATPVTASSFTRTRATAAPVRTVTPTLRAACSAASVNAAGPAGHGVRPLTEAMGAPTR